MPPYINDRMEALGGLGAAVCAYHQKILTERQSQEMANAFLRRNPNLGPAANWVTETNEGANSMRVMLGYLSPDCKRITDVEAMTKAVYPFVKS